MFLKLQTPLCLVALWLLFACNAPVQKLTWQEFEKRELTPPTDVRRINIFLNTNEVGVTGDSSERLYEITDMKGGSIENVLQSKYPTVGYRVERKIDVTGGLIYWGLMLILVFPLPVVSFLYAAFSNYRDNWKFIFLLIIVLIPFFGSVIYWITQKRYRLDSKSAQTPKPG